MLPTKEVSRIAQERFAAYETGDPAAVLAVYTDDARYWDTKADDPIRGKEALSAYLGEYLRKFVLRYAVLEEHRLEGLDAAIVLWECAVRRRQPDGSAGAELLLQRGMNFLQVRDGKVCREDSYMDLASLDQLLAATA